jgi:acetylglutamate kinase
MSRLTSNERAIVVTALKHAAPYIRMYKRKTFVLKAGGEAFETADATRALVEQVAILHGVGIRVVLVHGGGPQSTALAKALGIESAFVDGRRVTDAGSLDVATMVLNGKINTMILAACRQLGLPAVGISGVDAGLIRAHKRPPVTRDGGDAIDYGFVGDIDSVDASVLMKQLDNDLVPVISPLSADESGTVLNINADTIADSGDRRAGHSRIARRSALADLVRRHRRSQTPQGPRPHRRRYAAKSRGDRARVTRRRAARARDLL